MEEEIRLFIGERKAAGSAENTLAAYQSDLNGLLAFCRENGIGGIPGETALASYLLRLEFDGRRPATMARILASIRTFYQYLLDKGVLEQDPSRALTVPEGEEKEHEFLTEGEISALLETPNAASPKGCRDRAMMELAYSCGLRVTELLELRIGDLDLQRNLLFLKKDRTGEIRPIPFGKYAAEALNAWLTIREQQVSAEQAKGKKEEGESQNYLFPNRNGGLMTRQGFYKILSGYAELAGLGEISPQALRDACAKHMLDHGAGCAETAGLLGVSESMMVKYLNHTGAGRLLEVYKKTHPRA
ncbi:MAG: tyrosine-type recombinase/integrase [Lachnospiraceae bacterium]|nr:tyrosine-type recombinase/integrase [Lachnospiraceae bacterium]